MKIQYVESFLTDLLAEFLRYDHIKPKFLRILQSQLLIGTGSADNMARMIKY